MRSREKERASVGEGVGDMKKGEGVVGASGQPPYVHFADCARATAGVAQLEWLIFEYFLPKDNWSRNPAGM